MAKTWIIIWNFVLSHFTEMDLHSFFKFHGLKLKFFSTFEKYLDLILFENKTVYIPYYILFD